MMHNSRKLSTAKLVETHVHLFCKRKIKTKKHQMSGKTRNCVLNYVRKAQHTQTRESKQSFMF